MDVNSSLTNAYLCAWIMKNVRHWLQDAIRRVRCISLEIRTADNTPFIYKSFFILLFVLTRDRGASEGHTSHPENGNIRIELKFNKTLPEAMTCLLYVEFDISLLVDFSRNVTTEF